MSKIYLLVISVALVALVGLTACAPGWGQPGQGQPSSPNPGGMMGGQGGMMGGQGGMMGNQGGMMGGQGGMMGGQGGMMGNQGGMMGNQGGMMGGSGAYSPEAEEITIDEAAKMVERYLRAYYGRDLVLIEVMEFTWNFYAEVEEQSTGIHAMELLIDKYTGQVSPETGPNMMWNTKYSMMGSSYPVTAQMPVTPEQAQTIAQQFLDTNLPGVAVGEADTFYGYYTLHTLKDGQIEGMLSVNGYTGAVWYHTWHGPFIGMKDFE